MATEQTIRVGDIGTRFELEVTEKVNGVDTAVDISGATTYDVIIQRPDRTTVTRAGTFTTDGTEGKLYLDSISGDLSIAGTYYIQADIALPSWVGKSSIGEFEVEDNLV